MVSSKPACSQADQIDDELVHGLSSWIRCAAVLGQVAASVAAQACCSKVANQPAKGDVAVTSQNRVTDSVPWPQQEQQEDGPAEEALRKASHKQQYILERNQRLHISN